MNIIVHYPKSAKSLTELEKMLQPRPPKILCKIE